MRLNVTKVPVGAVLVGVAGDRYWRARDWRVVGVSHRARPDREPVIVFRCQDAMGVEDTVSFAVSWEVEVRGA